MRIRIGSIFWDWVTVGERKPYLGIAALLVFCSPPLIGEGFVYVVKCTVVWLCGRFYGRAA